MTEPLVPDDEPDYAENGLPVLVAYKTTEGKVREGQLVDEDSGLYKVGDFGTLYDNKALARSVSVNPEDVGDLSDLHEELEVQYTLDTGKESNGENTANSVQNLLDTDLSSSHSGGSNL